MKGFGVGTWAKYSWFPLGDDQIPEFMSILTALPLKQSETVIFVADMETARWQSGQHEELTYLAFIRKTVTKVGFQCSRSCNERRITADCAAKLTWRPLTAAFYYYTRQRVEKWKIMELITGNVTFHCWAFFISKTNFIILPRNPFTKSPAMTLTFDLPGPRLFWGSILTLHICGVS